MNVENMDADLPELQMDLDVNDIEEIPSDSPVEIEKEVASKRERTSHSQVSSTADESNNPNKRKLTSIVRNDMIKKTVKGETVAVCKHCNKQLSAGSANGTSHLCNHLNRCLQNKKQGDIRQMMLVVKTTNNSSGSGVALGNWSFNQKTSWKKFAKAIIVSKYPLSIVEHKCFKEFIDGIQPFFKHISHNTMRKKVLGIYNAEKEILKNQLKGLNSRVAITTDLWTSNQKRGYMTVTAHYVDSNWMLQSRLLK